VVLSTGENFFGNFRGVLLFFRGQTFFLFRLGVDFLFSTLYFSLLGGQTFLLQF